MREYHAQLCNGEVPEPAAVHLICHSNRGKSFEFGEQLRWEDLVAWFSGPRTHFLLNSCFSYNNKASRMATCERPPASILAWRREVYSDDALEVTRAFYEELCRPNGHDARLAVRVRERLSSTGLLCLAETTANQPPQRTRPFRDAAWAWTSEAGPSAGKAAASSSTRQPPARGSKRQLDGGRARGSELHAAEPDAEVNLNNCE